MGYARQSVYKGVRIRHLTAGPGGSGRKFICPRTGKRRNSADVESESVRRVGFSATPDYERVRDVR